MPQSLAFFQPSSLPEAIALLEHYGDDARIVAGATALTIMLRQRLIQPAALISIAGLPELDSLATEDGYLRLGALATHRAVELSLVVQGALPVLATTFGKVANVRVRNVATVGGVLAEADYASDPPSVFLALDAEVEAVGPSGPRSIPIADFFRGFYETALAPNEVLTGVRVPLPVEGTHAIYKKYVTRSSEDRPCLGTFAALRLAADGTCADVRVAVGAASETPQRFPEIEAQARGQNMTEDLARTTGEQYAERIDPIADLRGSAWYRTEIIKVWVRRALLQVYAEASAAASGAR